MDSSEVLLEVKGITVRFGGITALDDVTFDIPRDKVCGLIGPNGAGKTTLFNCLSRLYQYQAGDLRFEGKSITQTPVHKMTGLGIGRTFQNLALFRTMTVRENILVGAHSKSKAGFLNGLWPTAAVREEEARLDHIAQDLIVKLKLTDVAHRPAGALPFGFQKRVEFARALAAQPRLLLLDEPAAGLNHEELSDLGNLIKWVRDDLGVTVLLVEHHMQLVMDVSDWIVVLNFGKKIAEGVPQTIQKHPEVVRAYLGGTSV